MKLPWRHAYGPLSHRNGTMGKETKNRIRRWAKRVAKRILDRLVKIE